MKTKTFHKKLLPLSIAFIIASPVIAQEEASDESNNTGFIEQIIVTGTASGTAIRKVDASYASTSLSAADILKLAPKSTAELFRAVPGVWAESSGGVSGANVFVRGFPGGGDAPFLTVQLQGVGIYTPPSVSFLENSTLFRVDETIQFMDALRGGPASVLSNGQPGLTTNFLLKEGSEITEGTFKYTTSDYGLQRIDAVLSGALDEDFYYMIGGYVQQSSGVRDAGFTSEKGNQFTINLTKELDNGKINLYTRITDDHGTWYTPSPLIDGVDNSFVHLGTLNRQATINYGPEDDSTSEAVDFGEGRGWDGSVSGGSINLELGDGWTFVDRFSFTKGEADTLGLVTNGDPVALSSVADSGDSATGSVTGNVYSGSTAVQQLGRWVVRKDIESFTNDLALTKTTDTLKASVGLFSSSYSSNDWWALGNHAYHVVQSGGEALAGIECNVSVAGCGWNYDINSTGDGKTTALYAALDYKFSDDLSADIGIRNENHEIEYSVDEGLDGVITKAVQYDESDVAYTLGVNWQFEKDSGVFTRYSEGSKMPYFDDFRDNFGSYSNGNDLISDVTQFELGYKLATSNYNVYATGFYNEVESSQTPIPGGVSNLFATEAMGIEFDAAYYADNGLAISLNATIQDSEIVESADATIIGNEAQRQPGFQLRVTPSYDFEMEHFYATLYGTLSIIDDRFADPGNTVVLDGYESLDLGLTVANDSGLNMNIAIQNLTDEDALTEGDPRNPTAPNGRFILPRTVTFSVGYSF
jgi:iron complex outermembrane receptor protein